MFDLLVADAEILFGVHFLGMARDDKLALIASLDAFAFANPATSSAVIESVNLAERGHTLPQCEDAVADCECSGHIDSAVNMLESPLAKGTVKEHRSLAEILEDPGGLGPHFWRAQVKAVLSVGAKGSVETFHDMLTTLSNGGNGSHFLGLCASLLSAQTRDAAVMIAVERLANSLGSGEFLPGRVRPVEPAAVAAATQSDLEDILRGVNYHKTKAKNLSLIAEAILKDHSGQVPSNFEDLIALPGVGPKIANLVLSVVFGQVDGCGMVVDTHVHRISRRLGWTNDLATSPERTRRALEVFIPEEVRELVTRRLVGFGQVVCLPRGPLCNSCPVAERGLCPAAVQGEGAETGRALACRGPSADPITSGSKFARLRSPQRGATRVIELEDDSESHLS